MVAAMAHQVGPVLPLVARSVKEACPLTLRVRRAMDGVSLQEGDMCTRICSTKGALTERALHSEVGK